MEKDYSITHSNDSIINIDNKDKKILSELSINCRQSNAEIGRKVNLSKQSVAKRIKILEKTNVIICYTTYFVKLKDSVDYYILIKLKNNINKEDLKNKIFGHGQIQAIWFTIGLADLVLVISTTNSEKLNKIVNEILNLIGDNINKFEIVEALISGYTFYKDYLIENKNRKVIRSYYNNEKISENDIKIIGELFNNGRITLIELSQKLRLSINTVSNRIKYLIKNKFIINPGAIINLPVINYHIVHIFISVSGNIEEIENKLMKIMMLNLNFNLIWRIVGNYNLLIMADVDTINKLISLIEIIKDELKEDLIKYDILITNSLIISNNIRKSKVELIINEFNK